MEYQEESGGRPLGAITGALNASSTTLKQPWTTNATEIAMALAFTFISLVFYFRGVGEIRQFLTDPTPLALRHPYLPMLGAVVFAFAGIGIGYDRTTPMLRRLARAVAVGLVISLLFDPPDIVLANPSAQIQHDYISNFYWAALALAAASWWRPSCLFAVVIYIISERDLWHMVTGIRVSLLDMHYLLDTAGYLSIFVVLGFTKDRWLGRKVLGNWQDLVALIAIGMHLANYFWSAYAKMIIGPHVWSWVIENKTYNLTAYSLENRTLPIGGFPTLVQHVYDLEKLFIHPLNLFIIGIQAFAIICVFRPRWMRIAAYCYDILHVGIYLVGGVFFWAWIWNNIAVIVSLRGYKTFTAPQIAACLLTITLGHPNFGLINSALLGWFDVANARQTYVDAETTGGRTVRVPFSFFLSNSHPVGLGYLNTVEMQGHYPHIWWASGTYAMASTENGCHPPAPVSPQDLEPPEKETKRLQELSAMLKANHARMLEYTKRWGHYAMYFRLHHNPSNPFLFSEFNSLDLSTIKRYNIVVSSMCHGIEHGVSTAKAIFTTKVPIDVQ